MPKAENREIHVLTASRLARLYCGPLQPTCTAHDRLHGTDPPAFAPLPRPPQRCGAGQAMAELAMTKLHASFTGQPLPRPVPECRPGG